MSHPPIDSFKEVERLLDRIGDRQDATYAALKDLRELVLEALDNLVNALGEIDQSLQGREIVDGAIMELLNQKSDAETYYDSFKLKPEDPEVENEPV
jgi:hypothetical protein